VPWVNGVDVGWCGTNLSSGIGEHVLYQWSAAMNGSTTEGAQGKCPTGWHIPTDNEQYILENYLKDDGQGCDNIRSDSWACSSAGTKLKTGGSSNFNALLAGGITSGTSNSPYPFARGSNAYFWSSTSYDGTKAITRALTTPGYTLDNSTKVGRLIWNKFHGYSVRCIKNLNAVPALPTILSIVRQNPTDRYTNVTSAVLRIAFSKDVVNVGEGDFALSGSAASAIAQLGSRTTITQVSPSVYDFTIPETFGGMFILRVSGEQDIKDLEGNPYDGLIGNNQSYWFYAHTPHKDCQPADVNCDQSINIADVQTAINVILKIDQDAYHSARTDVDSSGGNNIQDVQELINVIINKP